MLGILVQVEVKCYSLRNVNFEKGGAKNKNIQFYFSCQPSTILLSK